MCSPNPITLARASMTDERGIQELRDIEAIRQLKAHYVRFGDTKQWDKLGELFTDDYEAHFDSMPRMSKEGPISGSVTGRQNFVELFRTMLVSCTTIHQLYSSEITITGPNTATGIWAMHDVVMLPNCIFEGWGHYHDQYVKVAGVWKLSKSHTTRIRSEERWL